MNTRPVKIPAPGELRAWVAQCLPLLGVSAAQLSRELDLGRNTLGNFMSSDARGINLHTAHILVCKIHEKAQAAGEALPPLGDANA